MPGWLHRLALCNLLIGTGAFVIGGILTPLAGSLGFDRPAWVGAPFAIAGRLTLRTTPRRDGMIPA